MYFTVLGDTWDVISYKLYNTEMNAGRLMEANTRYMRVGVFPAGVALVVPDLPKKDKNTAALPPWKRTIDN